MKVLHIEDSGVSFEKCVLTRFHTKLLDNTFCAKGPVIDRIFMWIHCLVKCHFKTLIYQTVKTHLTLHVYLIPSYKRKVRYTSTEHVKDGQMFYKM